MKIEVCAVLVVVALVGAYGVASVPHENRLAGNEVAAMGSLRGIAAAQSAALTLEERGERYRASLSSLQASAPPNDLISIDPILAGGTKQGYVFAITSASEGGWTAAASPLRPGVTGKRYFGISMQGEIYVSETGPVRFFPDGSSPDEPRGR